MRRPTNWNDYSSNPTSFLSKYFFFNFVTRAYMNLLKSAEFKKPIKILEFGAGTGYLDLFLAKRLEVKKVAVIEFNEKMVNILKKTLANLDCEKEIIHKNFFDVTAPQQTTHFSAWSRREHPKVLKQTAPFKVRYTQGLCDFNSKEQFDLVHSQGVIEHFETEKRIELLKKHYDATKKGGYCIVYSPTPTLVYLFFKKIAEILGTWKFHDEVPLKKEVIIQEMESLGFETVKVNYFWRWFLTEVGILFKKRL